MSVCRQSGTFDQLGKLLEKVWCISVSIGCIIESSISVHVIFNLFQCIGLYNDNNYSFNYNECNDKELKIIIIGLIINVLSLIAGMCFLIYAIKHNRVNVRLNFSVFEKDEQLTNELIELHEKIQRGRQNSSENVLKDIKGDNTQESISNSLAEEKEMKSIAKQSVGDGNNDNINKKKTSFKQTWNNTIKGLSNKINFKSTQYRTLMIGMAYCRKSMIISVLSGRDPDIDIPTMGFNIEKIQTLDFNFSVWHVGAQPELRDLWKHYYPGTHGIVCVVDIDGKRLETAKWILDNILDEHELKGKPIVILCDNKDALNCHSSEEIEALLECKTKMKDRPHACFPYVSKNLDKANTNEKERLYNAFKWLYTQCNATQ